MQTMYVLVYKKRHAHLVSCSLIHKNFVTPWQTFAMQLVYIYIRYYHLKLNYIRVSACFDAPTVVYSSGEGRSRATEM